MHTVEPGPIGRSTHRAVQGEIRTLRVSRALAYAAGCGSVVACVQQGPLFDDVIPNSPANSTPGRGNSADTPEPITTPTRAGETPPVDAKRTPPVDDASRDVANDAGAPIVPCTTADGGFLADCDPNASTDPCTACLAGECSESIATCATTPGCSDIAACAKTTGCIGDACFCGTIAPAVCATTGQGNGACRDVILMAPGAHLPTPIDPTAGPGAEAARLVGECRRLTVNCREACGS
jgi:hypothetical protein